MTRHFLAITDFSKADIESVFDLAASLKAEVKRREFHHHLYGYTLAMIFAKPSARTPNFV